MLPFIPPSSVAAAACAHRLPAVIIVFVALALIASTAAAQPYIDTGFAATTPRPDPDLVIVREQYYGAGGVDLSAYGMGSGNTYVQSIYFRLFVDNDAPSIDSYTGLVVFPEEVTILGFITEGAPLGGSADDGIFTQSDLVFGIGGDPDRYSEAARGFGESEFIGELSNHSFTFGLSVADGVDDFRVVIDYGDSLATELSFDLFAFDVGTLGGAVPTVGVRVGNDADPVVFGSGDFGETAGLLGIPLTSTTPPTTGDTVPFDPLANVFIIRDRGPDSTVDGYDTNYDVPLPDLFPVPVYVTEPVGLTDGNDGLLYGAGADGGLAVVNVVAGTVESKFTEDRAGTNVAITNVAGSDSVFIVRDTGSDSMIDVLNTATRTLGSSFALPSPGTPVDIADGPDSLLYVLGSGGTLASVAPDGSGFASVALSQPTGDYVGLTSRPGSPLMYLVRDNPGDTSIDSYDVDTQAVTFDVATFPNPGAPVGITDGPDDHLYVIGLGGGGPAAYAEIDPATGTVVLTHSFMDFGGDNRALTNLEVLTVVSVENRPVPVSVLRHRAVPNPFNPTTRIEFTLPSSANVSLRVYDVSGRLVRTLAAGEHYDAGPNSVAWNGVTESGKPAASGLYFYRIETRVGVGQGKLVLIK